MARSVEPRDPATGGGDLPMWVNTLITGDTPIRWRTEDGEPPPGEELAGRIMIGHEEQLVVDVCGTAATNLLAVLIAVHRDAVVPVPARQ